MWKKYPHVTVAICIKRLGVGRLRRIRLAGKHTPVNVVPVPRWRCGRDHTLFKQTVPEVTPEKIKILSSVFVPGNGARNTLRLYIDNR